MSNETPVYKNHTRSIDERVDDLVARMSVKEKISQMLYGSKAIDHLGIPSYNWWSECLHGVARAGKATVFPQAIGLGASFDPELARRVAAAISDEARAKHHAAVRAGNRGQYRGLTFWTPNINIFRDPRWGRGQETYGEDPWLMAEIGTAFVQGLQGDDPKYLKTAACAKHYAVHSGPEKDRHTFDAVVSKKDLWETYLPAFKALVDAGVEAVMGAYNRTNGEPCCGSRTLITEILRGKWKFQGHFVSDCWAVNDFHKNHKVTSTAEESAAWAVKEGCDLNCGCAYEYLLEALRLDLLGEEHIDSCVKRLLRTRFKLGMFDPEDQVPYAAISADVVNCPAHIELAREAAAKSIVLLKNKDSVLPLKQDLRSLSIIGPYAAHAGVLLGNYHGVSPQLVTFLEGIVGAAPASMTIKYNLGCLATQQTSNPVDWCIGDSLGSDVVVAVVGIDPTLEGEEGDAIVSDNTGDRTSIELPEPQRVFLRKLLGKGTPVVIAVTGGGAIDLSEFEAEADAILQVWYPGEQGGNALADVLFGISVPSGRLPVTFYRSIDQLPPFEDYSMDGRTYRFMTESPLFPFGFGLSYTEFDYSDVALEQDTIASGDRTSATLTVTNQGECAAEEVVQLYVSDCEASVRVPLAQLNGTQRVQLQPGESKAITFEITPEMLMLVDNDGESCLEAGEFRIAIGGSSPCARSRELGAPISSAILTVK